MKCLTVVLAVLLTACSLTGCGLFSSSQSEKPDTTRSTMSAEPRFAPEEAPAPQRSWGEETRQNLQKGSENP